MDIPKVDFDAHRLGFADPGRGKATLNEATGPTIICQVSSCWSDGKTGAIHRCYLGTKGSDAPFPDASISQGTRADAPLSFDMIRKPSSAPISMIGGTSENSRILSIHSTR
jgi:hypothetical protein